MAALIFLGCQQYTMENLPAERLHFGSGGGFTGKTSEYILLLSNGKILFKDELKNELESVGRLTKQELAELKDELAKVDFKKATDKPGNMSSFVSLYSGNEAQKVQWPAGQKAPETAIVNCYDILMNHVRRLRAAR